MFLILGSFLFQLVGRFVVFQFFLLVFQLVFLVWADLLLFWVVFLLFFLAFRLVVFLRLTI